MGDGREQLIFGMRMGGTKQTGARREKAPKLKNNKALGQHWLYNRAILEEIAELAADGEDFGAGSEADSGAVSGASKVAEKTGVEKVRTCVEIGPGLGTLTASLLRRFERVIAVEYDAKLAKNLPGSFPGKNLEVVNADFLEVDLEFDEDYVIAGNIPYYITSPILEKVLTVSKLPKRVVLLMQKEVAERILSEKETVSSLFVKNRAEMKAGPVVLRGEFTPPPKVDSQVLVLEPHAPEVDEAVFDLIRAAFKAPRKKVVHNLTGVASKDELLAIFSDLELNPDARPGDLHLRDYQKLYEKLRV